MRCDWIDKEHCPCCKQPVKWIKNDTYSAIVCNKCRKVLYDRSNKSADTPEAILKNLHIHMQSYAEKWRDSLHEIEQKGILHEKLKDEEKQLISHWREYHTIYLELEAVTRNNGELQGEDKKKLYCLMEEAKQIEKIAAALDGRMD